MGGERDGGRDGWREREMGAESEVEMDAETRGRGGAREAGSQS